MPGPGGREVGRISVRVVPDTSHLLPELRTALRGVESRVNLNIDVELDTAGLVGKAKAAAATATAAAGNINLDVDLRREALARLRGRVRAIVTGLNRVRQNIVLGMTVDQHLVLAPLIAKVNAIRTLVQLKTLPIRFGVQMARLAPAELIAKVRALSVTVGRIAGSIPLRGDLKVGDLVKKVAATTRAVSRTAKAIKLDLELVTAPLIAKLRTFTAFVQKFLPKVNVGMELNTMGFVAKLHAFIRAVTRTAPKVHIETELDRDASFGAATRQIRGLLLAALLLGPALIPIGAALVGAFLPLVALFGAATAGIGALAAVAIPAMTRITKARKELVKAQEKLADAKTAKQIAAAQEDINKALAGLSPQEAAVAKSLDRLGASWKKFQAELQPTVLPLLGKAIDGLNAALPALAPFVRSAASAVSILMDEFAGFARSDGAKSMLKFFQMQARPAILTLGRVFQNVFVGMGGVLQGFGPLIKPISDALVRGSAAFAQFGLSAASGKNKGFQDFLAYVISIGPKVMDFLGAFVRAAVKLVQALAPIGEVILSAFTGLLNLFAKLDPKVITGVLVALLAFGSLALVGNAMAAFAAGVTSAQVALARMGFLLSAPLIALAAIVGLFVAVYKTSKPVRDAVKSVMDAFNTEGLVAALKAIGPALKKIFPIIVSSVKGWATAFVGWLGPQIPVILAQLQTMATAIGNWIVAQVPVIVAQVLAWGQAFVDWIRPKIPGLLASLGGLLAAIGGWVIGVGLPALLGFVSKWGSAFVDWVGPRIVPALEALGRFLGRVGDWIVKVGLPKLVTLLDKWGTAFINWVRPKIGPALAALGGLLLAIGGWILTVALPAIVTKLREWALAFIEWIGPRIPGIITELGKFLGAVVRWVIGTGLPMLAGAIVRLGLAFLGWVIARLPGLIKEIGTFFGSIVTKLPGIVAALLIAVFNVGVDMIAGLIQGVKNGIGEILKTLGEVKDAILGFFKGAGEWLKGVGASIVNGLKRGLDAGGKDARAAGASLGNAVTQGARGAVEAKSPSKVFIQLGRDIIAGLAIGLTGDAAQKVIDTSTRFVEKLADIFNKRISTRSTLVEKLKKDNLRVADLIQKRTDILLKISQLEQDLDRVKPGKNAAAQRDSIQKRIAAAARQLRDINVDLTRARNASEIVRDQIAALDRLPAALVKPAALTRLKAVIAAEQKILEGFATQREALAERIEEGKTKLKDAIQLRDDFFESVQRQHIDLAAVMGFSLSALEENERLTSTHLFNFMSGQLDKILAFRETLGKLSARGLNDTMFRQLAEAGAESGGAFANALLDGAVSIDAFNTLQTRINDASAGLASDTSIRLHQAGVDIAQAFLEGLQSEDAALVAQMQHIADALVATVKKALGIASPSKVFRRLAESTIQGYILGLRNIQGVHRAATRMAQEATQATGQTFTPTSGGSEATGRGKVELTLMYPPDKPSPDAILSAFDRLEALFPDRV